MSMFSSALASGQLGPLMSQFGLPAEAVDAANRGGERQTHKNSFLLPETFYYLLLTSLYICVWLSDVEAFARAMQGSKGDSKEKKEDDEDMSLD